MNFRTTLLLLVVVIALGAFVFYTREEAKTAKPETVEADRKLIDATPTDVKRVAIINADGFRTVIEKDGTNWRLSAPVAAPAETFEVDTLLRVLTDLRSHATVEKPTEGMGLAKPQFKVELGLTNGKTHVIAVGSKGAVGDNLYVALDGSKSADVVGTSLLEQLEKPASTYRDPKLISMATADVKQITVSRPDATIVLNKNGNDWQMTQPRPMPAETSAVDDLIFAVTGLRSVDWVSEEAKDLHQYQLDNPRMTVALSTGAPTTAPAASQPATKPSAVIVKIGRYDDVLKKNVFVTTSGGTAVAKVAAGIVDSLNKKPIELRDKKVLNVDPASVAAVTIVSDSAATTQPTTKPASHREVLIARARKPATQPATQVAATGPATTQATQPVAATEPAQKWELLGEADARKPADDSKVDELIGQLAPLRAERYLESNPTTVPSTTYTLKITTQAAGGAAPEQHTITITDPGSGMPTAEANGLVFEVSRMLVDKLAGDFNKGATPAANPAFPEVGR